MKYEVWKNGKVVLQSDDETTAAYVFGMQGKKLESELPGIIDKEGDISFNVEFRDNEEKRFIRMTFEYGALTQTEEKPNG